MVTPKIRVGQRWHHYETEPLALFEWSLKQGMWAKGPLPNGPKGESND